MTTENIELLAGELSKKEMSQCDQLIQAFLNTPGTELFHDEYSEAFAKLPHKNGIITVPIKSKKFSQFIRNLHYKKTKGGLSRDILEKAIGTLAAVAQFEGKQYTLALRVAYFNNAIWYDLGEKVVCINENGWTVLSDVPTIFRQYSIQQGQVTPEKGGSLDRIFDFINVTKETDRLLLITFLISAFIPDIPHPILIIIGPQGAAKSTLEKVILKIIDPAMTDDVPINNIKELLQAVSHRWVVPFDNLSSISKEISDLFCKLVTGAGFSKRELYTDDDDVIRKFRRILILNGINMPVGKSDILDRSIILELERIKSTARVDEKTLLRNFETALPKIFGACLDVLSKAMAIYPRIKLNEKPRMADFAIWGCAIAEASGYSQKQFLDAYNQNIERQTMEALDASPLATVLIRYFEDNLIIEGTASTVLDKLREHIYEAGIDPKFFPTNSRALGRKLQEITPNLTALGYLIERQKTSDTRWIRITRPRKDKNIVNNVTTSSSNGQNDKSDIFPPEKDLLFELLQ